ncbi:MAG: phage integrase SAM-like domain-containing protein [Dysgonomonas sp.]
MKNFTMRFVYDRKNETGYRKKEKDKTYKDVGLLQIEVKEDGTDRRAWVSTGVKITPDQFAMKDGVLKIKNHDNAKSLSGKVNERFREVFAFVESDKCKNISDVKYWNKSEVNTTSFIRFIEDEARKENLGKSSLSNYNSFLSKLNEFGQIKQFSDLTYNNIVDFDRFLKPTNKSQPVLYRKHKHLEHYINIAIKKGIINRNPYIDFEVKKGKHKKPTFLTPDELEKIKAWNPVYEKMQRIKDLFLFQCFTGLAYIDMQSFSKDSIVLVNGEEAIRSNRIKTDESYVLLFLPIAKQIAEKYNYKLPVITNQKYNEYLSLLAGGADINKNITSHIPRHVKHSYCLVINKLLGCFSSQVTVWKRANLSLFPHFA